MPRGAEYADGPVASDNAIDAGENKIAGADVCPSLFPLALIPYPFGLPKLLPLALSPFLAPRNPSSLTPSLSQEQLRA